MQRQAKADGIWIKMVIAEKTAQNRFLLIYVLWWGGWYFVADNMRVVHISSEATTAVFASIGATIAGAVLARALWPAVRDAPSRDASTARVEPWVKTALRVYIGIQLVLLILALRGMAVYGREYRSIYFGDPGLIFGHRYVEMLYDNCLNPLASYLLIRWLTAGGELGSWYRYVAVTGLAAAAIVNGRFGVYNAMFLTGIALVLGNRAGKKVWLGILASVPIGFAILYFRTGVAAEEVNEGQVKSDFRDTVINYHVLGFYLLDYHIRHRSISSDFPLCNSLGIFGLPIYGFAKYALHSDSAPYCYGHMLVVLDKNVEIEDFGFTNAFGTNLLPFYADGGVVLVAIAFAGAGFMLCLRGRDGHVNPIAIQILYLLVFGLFQPILNSGLLLVPLLFHWATYRRSNASEAPARDASLDLTP